MTRWTIAPAALLTLCLSSAHGATLDSLNGTATVQRHGGVSRVDARKALPLPLTPGDHVATEAGARARVTLDDGSEITLGSGAELVIPTPEGPKSQSAPQLLYGLFRIFVRKHLAPGSEWRVRANNATMGVRGTQFVVDASRDRTMMCTFEGTVSVRTAEDPTRVKLVGPNQGVVVSSEGRVSNPVTMDPAQMQYWREGTLVNAPDSDSAALRSLGREWQWAAATSVEYFDPNALYSQFSSLAMHADAWGRAVQAENTPLGRAVAHPQALRGTARAAIEARLVPNRTYLLFVEPSVGVKAGTANPDTAGFRLTQAFAMARLNSQHSLVVGRQEWSFGDGLLIGREPWQPFTRAYDGALATLRWAPARVRLFSSTLTDRTDRLGAEDWMAGAYAELSGFPVELYGIWVKRGGANDLSNANNVQARYAIAGERTTARFGEHLLLDDEVAYERGNIGTPGLNTETLSALLLYLDGGAATQLGSVAASLKGVYLRASGDRSPGGGTYGAFIPLVNDTHRFLGLVNAFPQLRNVQRAGTSLSARAPIWDKPLLATLDYSHFWRTETADVIYPAVVNNDQAVLGDEIDLQFSWEVFGPINAQWGAGYLVPGAAFGPNRPAAYLAFLSAQLRI